MKESMSSFEGTLPRFYTEPSHDSYNLGLQRHAPDVAIQLPMKGYSGANFQRWFDSMWLRGRGCGRHAGFSAVFITSAYLVPSAGLPGSELTGVTARPTPVVKANLPEGPTFISRLLSYYLRLYSSSLSGCGMSFEIAGDLMLDSM